MIAYWLFKIVEEKTLPLTKMLGERKIIYIKVQIVNVI